MAERFTYLGKQNIEKTASIWKFKSFLSLLQQSIF